MLSLVIPEINHKPANTKDAVISILTTDWPLSLRQIFYNIKKSYGYSSSYQAVYKAVKELLQEKVLTSKDKKYELNIDWVKKLQSFTDIVETNYYAKERMHKLSGIKESGHKEDIIILNFESIFDAEKYLYYFMKAELMKINNDTICHLANNEWRPLCYLRAEYNYYKRLISRGHKFYSLCYGSSLTEQECVKLYKKFGVNFKLVKEKFTNDILVFSDYFINIYIPEELQIKMKSYLENKETIKLLNEVLDKKASIRVIITKDKSLASELKNQTLRKFKNKTY